MFHQDNSNTEKSVEKTNVKHSFPDEIRGVRHPDKTL